MIVGSLIRLEQQYRAEGRIRSSCKNVRSRTSGSGIEYRVVDVARKGQVAAKRHNIGSANCYVLGKLALDAKVPLPRMGPLEIGRHRKEAAAGGKRPLVREGISPHESVIGIAQRSSQRHSGRIRLLIDVGEREAGGKRLEVGHRVPLVARDAPIEQSERAANRGLSITFRINRKANARRKMGKAGRN